MQIAKKYFISLAFCLMAVPLWSAQTSDPSRELLEAAQERDWPRVQTLLADSRVAVNARDNGGLTALMRAANYGELGIIQALFAHRNARGELDINVNARDDVGMTALIYAAQGGYADAVRALLAHRNNRGELDIEVNARNSNESTASNEARRFGHPDIVGIFTEYLQAHPEAQQPAARPASPQPTLIDIPYTECSPCVVCMERACNAVFMPCKHLCCCQKCANTIMTSTDIPVNQRKKCPMCRGALTEVVNVFMPQGQNKKPAALASARPASPKAPATK